MAVVGNSPYRRVRHPVYTVVCLRGLSALLLTANWLIGAAHLAALTLIVVTRIDREEAALIEKFGDDCREHMRRTGRFLPRLSRGLT